MSNPGIISRPLSYADKLELRAAEDISLIVIHCTELPDLTMAREYGEQIHYPASGTGNSGHFYIDQDGRVEQWVDPLRVAHHVAEMNQHSVGIELVNRGRYPHWFDSRHQLVDEPYTQVQVDALIALLGQLTKVFSNLTRIAGHQDLDARMIPSEDDPTIEISRKIDPGPLFPWLDVLSETSLERVEGHG